MNPNPKQQDRVTSAILAALGEKVAIGNRALDNDEDVFGALGLDSMQTFGVLVSLERKLGVSIGVDDESEFDRIRTFGGLKTLLNDKLAAQ
jgi:acyl carrier protein